MVEYLEIETLFYNERLGRGMSLYGWVLVSAK